MRCLPVGRTHHAQRRRCDRAVDSAFRVDRDQPINHRFDERPREAVIDAVIRLSLQILLKRQRRHRFSHRIQGAVLLEHMNQADEPLMLSKTGKERGLPRERLSHLLEHLPASRKALHRGAIVAACRDCRGKALGDGEASPLPLVPGDIPDTTPASVADSADHQSVLKARAPRQHVDVPFGGETRRVQTDAVTRLREASGTPGPGRRRYALRAWVHPES